MEYIEDLLHQQGQRLLLVETSGLPEFDLARQFYHKCQYTQEAVIRDFYTEGEDKRVLEKAPINYWVTKPFCNPIPYSVC